jgi:hypothetical protein
MDNDEWKSKRYEGIPMNKRFAVLATLLAAANVSATCWSDTDCSAEDFCRCLGAKNEQSGFCDTRAGECLAKRFRIGDENQSLFDVPQTDAAEWEKAFQRTPAYTETAGRVNTSPED